MQNLCSLPCCLLFIWVTLCMPIYLQHTSDILDPTAIVVQIVPQNVDLLQFPGLSTSSNFGLPLSGVAQVLGFQFGAISGTFSWLHVPSLSISTLFFFGVYKTTQLSSEGNPLSMRASHVASWFIQDS